VIGLLLATERVYFASEFQSIVPLTFRRHCPAPPRPYPLSLHDALPISPDLPAWFAPAARRRRRIDRQFQIRGSLRWGRPERIRRDGKSTRLNSSHVRISYALYRLKKKQHIGEFQALLDGRWVHQLLAFC